MAAWPVPCWAAIYGPGGQRATPWICVGIAVGTAGVALTGPPVHSAFRQALGVPALTVVDGQFAAGPGWTWLLGGLVCRRHGQSRGYAGGVDTVDAGAWGDTLPL
ncbi:MAG: hypothetical protein M0Z54_02585, partial [Thermaerobacter sp.]|nr:hypothetical protein [Thermaerobacter sp.]